jgi:hypothetical protein
MSLDTNHFPPITLSEYGCRIALDRNDDRVVYYGALTTDGSLDENSWGQLDFGREVDNEFAAIVRNYFPNAGGCNLR